VIIEPENNQDLNQICIGLINSIKYEFSFFYTKSPFNMKCA